MFSPHPRNRPAQTSAAIPAESAKRDNPVLITAAPVGDCYVDPSQLGARPVNFASDNVSNAAPEILAAIASANVGTALPYGEDTWTERLQTRMQGLFEHPATVVPVATGTAANALILATMAAPWGAIYCHADAHINIDECGSPEFYSGGAKIVPLAGIHGKISPTALADALRRAGAGDVHRVQPAALSISQPTELGTVYSPQEIRALADLAHAHGLRVHLDGARFANAVAQLGCEPAATTWRVGVDAMSFGGTKNGAVCAEAAVFFDAQLLQTAYYRRKRAGHLMCKMRYCSAQLEALITNGLWLRHASRANRAAAQLGDGLATVPGVRLVHPVEVNEVFVEMPSAMIQEILAEGFFFYPPDPDGVVRLATSFNSREADVAALVDAARRHAVGVTPSR
jgi:threonine aldolase